MSKALVNALCICRAAGSPMERVGDIMAVAGVGLQGDRYSTGEGSWNKGKPGSRQVTLINGLFFLGTPFLYEDCRRNIIVTGTELMDLIGKEFDIGLARMRGVKYCDPCLRPSVLSGKAVSFREVFFDRGGLIAEVISTGLIRSGDTLTPPRKSY